MNRQHGAELHLLAHFTADAFDANGVAGCDTILLSPGLYDGVHLPSKAYRQTTIIRVGEQQRQRAYFVDITLVVQSAHEERKKCKERGGEDYRPNNPN